jgi:hypothetical protein
MDAPARVVHPLIAIALVLAAICGYLLGNHRVSTGSGQPVPAGASQVANEGGVVLEYPAGWERTSSTQPIPGLNLNEAFTLSPRGSTGSGLLSGTVPAGEASPLPAAFLSLMKGAPHAEVVSLVTTQAYRYSEIQLTGYSGVFDLYAIPIANAGTRLMACFAPKRLTTAGEECEHIIANVTLTGTSVVTITPSATYAAALAKPLGTLAAERAKVRKQLAESASASEVVAPARSLAGAFASAGAAVGALEAPSLATPAQAGLSRALSGASKAYGELAGAALAEQADAYDAARARVTSAEEGVDRALENLVLLGYGPA